jgi:4-amino-4-deoxy-L-arabinose transferase-like glycosyltransferase
MIGFSHAAATDMPFSAMLTIAMVCAAVIVGLVPERSNRDGAQRAAPVRRDRDIVRRLALILFGVFLGLAVLAKGPAAIILCGGAVFFWALFTKRWRYASQLLHPVAMIAFCAIAMPWYILCARRNPDFFRIFIIEHNFKRFLTPEFQHIQPFWFYIPVLLAAFLPWTVGMLAALVDSRSRSALNAFFLSFGLFPVLFFTISRSKLPGYILPALPPLAWLLANTTNALVAKQPRRNLLVSAYAMTFIVLAIAIARFAAHRVLGTDIVPAPWTMSVWLPLIVAGILGAILNLRRDATAALCALQIGMLLATWSFSRGLAWMDSQLSARGVISANRTDVHSLSTDVFVYNVPRGIYYGLNFYLRRDIPEWTTQAHGPVFSSWKGQSSLKAKGYVCQQHQGLPAAILCQPPQASAAHASGGGKPE